VSVFVNTGDQDINAVKVSIKFPPDKLQIVSPTAGKSFISVWVSQPEFSNIDGIMNLTGGLPSPGINTSSGLVTTIIFRVKRPGEANIEFIDSSKVLKNDGQGTNILNSLINGRYKFLIPPPEGPIVTSPTHPDKNNWYNDPNPVFSWTKDEGVDGFSYELNRQSRSIPDNVSEGSHTIQEYSEITDNIWYFHIRARKTAWGGTTHFPVLIDTTPPAFFTPKLDFKNIAETERGNISFVTTDNASGIDHYELKIEKLDDNQQSNVTPIFFEVSSPYRLPSLNAGSYKITVRVYDQTGNWIDGSVTLKVTLVSFWQRFISVYLMRIWAGFALLIIILLIIALKIRYKRKGPYDSKKAAQEIDRVFDNLEQDLLAKLKELERSKTEGELSQKEKELHDKIIKDIQISEKKLKSYLDNQHSGNKQE
ncbi:hypothetical protein IID20_02450, partial [Patescibacteria group bacterium]|nr:hypothetical protein [Patescibacteria group bacterium]